MDELARKAALVDPAMAPGCDGAVRHGCRCSVLFNDSAENSAFVDPLCPLHGSNFDLARVTSPSW
jgi:hypothetical protein